MSSGHQLIAGVKSALKTRGLNFSDEWFEACVDWIKENNPTTQLTPKFLQDEVESQWLDANLMEMGCKCLPAKLADQKLVCLPEKYALQVNFVEDIGEASYSQWNKLKKLENENTNVNADSAEQKNFWEPKPRRCIHLTMTDGSQEVYGLEMSFIPQLSIDMKPGVKVQIIGPVPCRRGVIHLKAPNIKILGGEVEALLDINSIENVLQRRMNLKREDRPKLPRPKYKKPPDPPQSRIAPSQSQRQNPAPGTSFYSLPTQPVSSSAFKVPSLSMSHSRQRNNRQQRPTVEEDPFADDDDDVFMEIDESMLTAEQDPPPEETTLRISQATTNPPSQQPQRVPSTLPPSSSVPVIDILDDDDEEDEDDFLFSQIPSALLSSPPTKKPKLCSKSPFQFIKFIKDNLNRFQMGQTVYVKACVATLVSNVSVQNGQWTLRVNLNDGSGFLEAVVAPELLNRLIGYTATEIKQLKTSPNPADKAKIRNAMSGLSTALIHMNGICGIRIQKPYPVLATFEDVQFSHLQALRSRIATL